MKVNQRYKSKLALFMVTLMMMVALLSACSQGQEGQSDDNVPSDDQNQTETIKPEAIQDERFDTDLDIANTGGSLEITFEMKNISDESQTLTFFSGQRYDFSIWDTDGNSLYTWSADKSFIEMIQDEEMSTDQVITYTESFDAAGLEAGDYYIAFETNFGIGDERVTLKNVATFTVE